MFQQPKIKQIVWEKGYIEDQEYELVTYQTVELECGHKTKIKKDGFYRAAAECTICKNEPICQSCGRELWKTVKIP